MMMDRGSECSQGGDSHVTGCLQPGGVVVCFFTRRRLPQPIDHGYGGPCSDVTSGTGLEEADVASSVPTFAQLDVWSVFRTGVITLISLASIWAYSWAVSELLGTLMNVRVTVPF